MILSRNQLPWIVSFPRSGSHWVNCALELYSGRRRCFQIGFPMNTISLLSREVPREHFWIHTHQAAGIKKPKKVAFLTRDIVDVIYSYSWAQKRHTDDLIEHFIDQTVPKYFETYKKWLIDTPADIGVTYANIMTKPKIEFRKLVEFLEFDWDEVKALQCLGEVTKSKLAENGKLGNAFFGPQLMTEEYKIKRGLFRSRYGHKIHEIYHELATKSHCELLLEYQQNNFGS